MKKVSLIRKLRLERGLSVDEVVRITGIPAAKLYRHETSGAKTPKKDDCRRYALLYDTDEQTIYDYLRDGFDPHRVVQRLDTEVLLDSLFQLARQYGNETMKVAVEKWLAEKEAWDAIA